MPYAELKALIDTYAPSATINQYNRTLVTVSSRLDWETIMRRGAYIRIGGLVLGNFDIHRVQSEVRGIISEKLSLEFRSFAVRSHDTSGHRGFNSLVNDIGHIVKEEFPKSVVNLESPEVVFIAMVHGNEVLLGITLRGSQSARWYPRRPRAKPFFHPSALYPKFARALVNLARVREGELIMDPFCGTGSILTEASCVGANSLGIDVSMKMCRGAIKNLNFLKLPFIDVLNADATHIPFVRVDGVATDIPYGRCASTLGQSSANLLNGFMDSVNDRLKKDRYCCIVHPSNVELNSTASFEVIEDHHIYVHRNLTRIVSILRRN